MHGRCASYVATTSHRVRRSASHVPPTPHRVRLSRCRCQPFQSQRSPQNPARLHARSLALPRHGRRLSRWASHRRTPPPPPPLARLWELDGHPAWRPRPGRCQTTPQAR
eukprot:360591-Chlamydomonas_euryale.AAC.10